MQVSGCTVECTISVPPGASPDSTPSGPSTTSSTSSSPVTQRQTIDDASARAAGVDAVVAAVSAKDCRLCGRRAQRVNGKPASTIRRAMGAPWLPSPMNPTRSASGRPITRERADRETRTCTRRPKQEHRSRPVPAGNRPSHRAGRPRAWRRGALPGPVPWRVRALAACTLRRTTCKIRCERSGSGTSVMKAPTASWKRCVLAWNRSGRFSKRPTWCSTAAMKLM